MQDQRATDTRVWKKAKRSEGQGACVEVAKTDAAVYVRDSMLSNSPELSFAPDSWTAFIATVKSGELG